MPEIPLPLVNLSPAPPPAPIAPTGGERWTLAIQGMHCAACVGRVERALAAAPGVLAAHVNLPLGQATAAVDPARAKVAELQAAVAAAGYSAEPVRAEETATQLRADQSSAVRQWRTRFLVALVATLPLMLGHVSFLPHQLQAAVQLVLACVLQTYVAWPFYLGALKRLRYGGANMDTLVALGSSAAFGAGLVDFFRGTAGMTFMDGAMILTFLSLGKYLEAAAKSRGSEAILKLLELAPPTANVLVAGRPIPTSVREVAPGVEILVPPGERIPLDAEILHGASAVNEAWLTGESLPVDKHPGHTLFGGTINGDGALTARVLRRADETSLARTIELVRQAQESKAEVQQTADRIVEWFVPAVLLIAATTLAVWIFAGQFAIGFTCAVAVLVVACPCAMGLATPVAVFVATGRGAELGILIKESRALEAAARITHVVFDKTGTITLGKPEVIASLSANGAEEVEWLTLAAEVEQAGHHPLAFAVLQHAKQCGISAPAATSLLTLPGRGVAAQTRGGFVQLGNRTLVTDAAFVARAEAAADPHGAAPLFVVVNNQLRGALLIADRPAPDSRAAVAALQRLGVRTTLLSGDRRAAAESVAREVGIANVIAEVDPAAKLRTIAELQAKGERVAMVGDGINDAPALAAADLGLAMGSGADVAVESADMVLTRRDLRGVEQALRLSRKTLRIIHGNLAWAFGYNLLLIPFAAGVWLPWFGLHLPPTLAAAAMAAGSVTVVLNSLRLRRFV